MLLFKIMSLSDTDVEKSMQMLRCIKVGFPIVASQLYFLAGDVHINYFLIFINSLLR